MTTLIEQLISLDESLGTKNVVRGGGKTVKRRMKFSKSKNASFNNATKKRKLVSAGERAKRSRTQKIAAKKRRGGHAVANIKRRRSMNRRKSLGF